MARAASALGNDLPDHSAIPVGLKSLGAQRSFVREWLEHEDLPENVLSAIEKTTYHRGKNLVFADTPLVLRMVEQLLNPNNDNRAGDQL